MAKYLLRLGEITLKSDQTRRHFLERLILNLKKSFFPPEADQPRAEKANVKIENQWSRIFVETENPKAPEIFSTTFGLISFSEVTEITFRALDDILKFGESFFKEAVRDKTFAVRAHVAKLRRPTSIGSLLTSDVNNALGAALKPYSKKVDLENPEFTAFVEIRGKKAYFFKNKIPAPGGLPLGSEGKVLALISGGFDSAVASYLMMKRGCEVDFLFFNLGGLEHLRGVYEVTKFLQVRWERPYQAKLFVLDFSFILQNIYERVEVQYWNILLKRFMFLAAEAASKEMGYEGFTTGSSIGQVSSQTLRNFGITTHSISAPHFHPLLGFDKTEIIKLAQKIGSYPLSEHVKEFCAITPEHPATHAELESVLSEENKLDKKVLEKILSEKQIYALPSLELENIINLPPSAGASGAKQNKIPTLQSDFKDRLMLDFRFDEARKKEPIAGAISLDLWEVFHNFSDLGVGPPSKTKLDKNKKYLAVCEEGVKSHYAAAYLRERGYDVENLKSGY